MLDILKYQFMQNALVAGLLASVVCGLIGVIFVEKKMVMLSGGIAHTSYGGVGLGYLLGFEPIVGAVLFSIAAALGIGWIKRHGGGHADVIIGLFWSLGMALGMVFIALMPGYPPDISTYLFGNILSVTRTEIVLMLILSLVVAFVVITGFTYWKAWLFDEEFTQILGISAARLEYFLLVMVALTVVVLIRVVGIVLVIALLTAPAATAGLLTRTFKARMLWSIILGMGVILTGLGLSYQFNTASGAAIVLTACALYLVAYLGTRK